MSEPFAICRGILQGSILSPMLFHLAMDPLLSEMRSKSVGISINGLFLGAFAHADDLRTMASKIEDTSKQALFVNSFTRSRGLHLWLEKCALLPPSNSPLTSSLKIDNVTSLPLEKSVKCLGVWWNNESCMYPRADSESLCCIFFQWSIKCLSRPPKPLSSCSIVESCILPVLLYESENWVLNCSLLQALESFQAELGPRVLKLPKFSSNTAPLLVLNLPTMYARVFCNKLSFLIRVCRGKSTSLSTQVFRSIALSEVTSMSVVKQRHFLNSILDTQIYKQGFEQPCTVYERAKETDYGGRLTQNYGKV